LVPPPPLFTKGMQQLYLAQNKENMAVLQAARNKDIRRGVKFVCFMAVILTVMDVLLFWLNLHISPRRMVAMLV